MKKIAVVILLIFCLALTYFIFKRDPEIKVEKANKKITETLQVKNLSTVSHNNAPVKLYIDTEAFTAIDKLISEAKKSLYIEIFIFHFDDTGKKIAADIVRKKEEGLDVKILIDSVGLSISKNNKELQKYFRENEIDLKIFNKSLFSETGINVNHRKIILADGEKVMLGGMNFGDQYKKKYHDLMIEIEGKAARAAQKIFFEDWQRAGGVLPPSPPPLEKQYGNTIVELIETSVTPDKQSLEIHETMLSAIKAAKKVIRITSPYFSEKEIIKALTAAAERGVKTEVIMPHNNNNLVYELLNLATAKILLENKVDIYFYKSVFSHTKAMIIDDIAILGSANLDQRSFTGNQEICAVIKDKALLEKLNKELFDKDIAGSEKATLETIDTSKIKKGIIETLDIFDYYF